MSSGSKANLFGEISTSGLGREKPRLKRLARSAERYWGPALESSGEAGIRDPGIDWTDLFSNGKCKAKTLNGKMYSTWQVPLNPGSKHTGYRDAVRIVSEMPGLNVAAARYSMATNGNGNLLAILRREAPSRGVVTFGDNDTYTIDFRIATLIDRVLWRSHEMTVLHHGVAVASVAPMHSESSGYVKDAVSIRDGTGWQFSLYSQKHRNRTGSTDFIAAGSCCGDPGAWKSVLAGAVAYVAAGDTWHMFGSANPGD